MRQRAPQLWLLLTCLACQPAIVQTRVGSSGSSASGTATSGGSSGHSATSGTTGGSTTGGSTTGSSTTGSSTTGSSTTGSSTTGSSTTGGATTGSTTGGGSTGGCPSSAPCQAGETRSESCGNCGVETDLCAATCQWSLGSCDTSVTGSIDAVPSRLLLAPGATASTNLHWSVSGTPTGEVWVSAAGAPEQLFASGASGSQSAPWIALPGPYVFSLYAGSAHQTRLAYVSVTASETQSAFGFDYWPHGQSSAALTTANWTPALAATIAADIDQMVSLGAQVVRLIVWPEANGFQLSQGAGGTFTSAYAQSLANLPALLALFADRHVKVILAFGNDWLIYDAPGGLTWWEWAYGTNGFPAFLADSVHFFSGFVTAAEESPSASTVLYYDLQNEVDASEADIWPYVRGMYDPLPIPPGKRGLSLLNVGTDTGPLSQQLECRQLDYVDFHVYPQSSENVPLGTSYATVSSAFPGSVTLVGELGQGAPDASYEGAQQSVVLGVASQARGAGVPYFLNWMLWDDAPPAANQIFGVGYAADQAKDLLGGLAATETLVPNADLEQVAAGVPAGWTGGPASATTVSAMGPKRSDAATNDYYGRVSSSNQPSSMWLSSPMFPVPGGALLFANGYVRSNGAKVTLTVQSYDGSKNALAPLVGTGFTPTGWSWNDYLQHAGSQRFALPANAAYALIAFSVQPTSAPAYLDVDAVSASVEPP
ncbi:MAG: hypothetical protein ACYCWW_03905 [Deltaproteobacteria bacterium]